MKSKNLLHLYTKDNYIHTQNRHVNYIINFSQKKKKLHHQLFLINVKKTIRADIGSICMSKLMKINSIDKELTHMQDCIFNFH